MNLTIDEEDREVRFDVAPELYGENAVQVAAYVFDKRAEVFVEEKAKAVEVTLAARRANEDLERLGREFLNELLNQEYRKLVGETNRNLSAMLVTQALMSARGGETPVVPQPLTQEQEAEVSKMMAESRREIAETMPKKLPPQGPPIPPEKP